MVAVAKKNDDANVFFDRISLLLNVDEASCKRKDMIWDSQQEWVRKAIVLVVILLLEQEGRIKSKHSKT
jgi:RNAse (barnase) inhibitor barstar